jgi:hypothetical protein
MSTLFVKNDGATEAVSDHGEEAPAKAGPDYRDIVGPLQLAGLQFVQWSGAKLI